MHATPEILAMYDLLNLWRSSSLHERSMLLENLDCEAGVCFVYKFELMCGDKLKAIKN